MNPIKLLKSLYPTAESLSTMFGVIRPQHKLKYFLAMASFRRVFSGKKVDKDGTSCFRLYSMEQ